MKVEISNLLTISDCLNKERSKEATPPPYLEKCNISVVFINNCNSFALSLGK